MTHAQTKENHAMMRRIYWALKQEGIGRGLLKSISQEFGYCYDHARHVIHAHKENRTL